MQVCRIIGFQLRKMLFTLDILRLNGPQAKPWHRRWRGRSMDVYDGAPARRPLDRRPCRRQRLDRKVLAPARAYMVRC